jgi:hypothetical protein
MTICQTANAQLSKDIVLARFSGRGKGPASL